VAEPPRDEGAEMETGMMGFGRPHRRWNIR
jgi:hypothetical protein